MDAKVLSQWSCDQSYVKVLMSLLLPYMLPCWSAASCKVLSVFIKHQIDNVGVHIAFLWGLIDKLWAFY